MIRALKKMEMEAGKIYHYDGVNRIDGPHPRVRGDLTYVRGDLSGVRGDLSECDITDADRERGIDIAELIEETK